MSVTRVLSFQRLFQDHPFCKAYRARFSSSMSKLWWISTPFPRKNSHFKEVGLSFLTRVVRQEGRNIPCME